MESGTWESTWFSVDQGKGPEATNAAGQCQVVWWVRPLLLAFLVGCQQDSKSRMIKAIMLITAFSWKLAQAIKESSKYVSLPLSSSFYAGQKYYGRVDNSSWNNSWITYQKMRWSYFQDYIDFKMSYDKVKWSFLQQALRIKGFSAKCCQWIERMVMGGSVGIKVNNEVGHYFQTKKVYTRVALCHPFCSISLQICL
jgi:hypothetical protein